MENLQNQINAEVILINSDVKNIENENNADKILVENDIDYVVKQRKIESVLLDKERAKNNLKMFLDRRKARLNGESNEVYNLAA